MVGIAGLQLIPNIDLKYQSLSFRESKRFTEIILKYNYRFMKKQLKFISHNTTYVPLDSVRYGESGSTKMIEEEKKNKLVNTNLYFSNQNSFTIFKNPPRRFRFNFILFIIREAQLITSIYQVTTME